MATIALRDGVSVAAGKKGELLVLYPPIGPPAAVPPALEPALREVMAWAGAGPPLDPALAAWLEARHVVASERVERIEAWGRARLPAGTDPGAGTGTKSLPLIVIPGARFTCHGCGHCCEGYTVAPVTGAERERLLARAADLAPHVPAPVEAWFVEQKEPGPDGLPTFALGKTATGACVFLDERKLCRIHTHLGGALKPLPCREFPLLVTRRPDATVVTLRPDCETLDRSRADGRPLEEQLDWLAEIASQDQSPVQVPPIVRVAGDTFVPYALARAIERRAIGFLSAAPTVEQAHLAIRDLVLGVARSLPARPDAPDLDRAEELAARAPLEALRRARGAVDRGAGLGAALEIFDILASAAPEFVRSRGAESPGEASERDARLAADGFLALRAALGEKLGLAPDPAIPPAALAEARAAAATSAGGGDPAVQDLVRACAIQVLGGARALASPQGLVFGFATLALAHLLARFVARLLASRRGAQAAAPPDWNRALGSADFSLRQLNLAPMAGRLEALYANLFVTDDLPA